MKCPECRSEMTYVKAFQSSPEGWRCVDCKRQYILVDYEKNKELQDKLDRIEAKHKQVLEVCEGINNDNRYAWLLAKEIKAILEEAIK